jgi:hypothetical protein
VLTAVELDNDSPLETYKVNDKIPNGKLPPKFKLCESAVPQFDPDERLGRRRMVAETFCAIAVPGHLNEPLTPNPSPAGGEGNKRY